MTPLDQTLQILDSAPHLQSLVKFDANTIINDRCMAILPQRIWQKNAYSG